MKISTRIERIDESLIAGKFSKNTQLDLRIVSNDQLSSFGMPHEATTILEGVRDLLNIWIRAGEAAGRRANLAKVRVQPASFGVDELNHILAITCCCESKLMFARGGPNRDACATPSPNISCSSLASSARFSSTMASCSSHRSLCI